jgi:putative nucleotidyltransferase with HDIG domain
MLNKNPLPAKIIAIELPDSVVELMETFINKDFEIYIVGGAVRDILSKRLLYDWDFTTNATPEEMLKFLPDAYYDNAYGTVGIPINNSRPYEITTFRTEHGYSDSRRPDKISWGESLEKDLERRDFTINAMAIKINIDKNNNQITKELIDLYQGQEALENKLIRAVGNPEERFSEDALRMMRAVRIATELDFNIEKDTLEAIRNNSASINRIAKERVKDELFKILKSAHPSEGIILLKESGLLKEILPEMGKTYGVEQKSPGRHHIYDVWMHSLMSLKNCPSTDPVVRLACLIHDIGKPATYRKLTNGTITFYNHEMVSARIAKNIAERLRFSNKDADKLYKLVRWHQFTVDEHQTDSAVRRFIRNVTPEYLTDMLDLRIGDRLGGGAAETSWRLEEFKKRLIEVQKQPFTVHDLKITGFDIMKELNLEPGPKIGELLNILFNEVVENHLPNEKETLLEKLKEIMKRGTND